MTIQSGADFSGAAPVCFCHARRSPAYRRNNSPHTIGGTPLDLFVTIFMSIFVALFYALFILMFIRALLSWLPISEDSVIPNFVYFITEPVITPVRMLLERSDFVRDAPIDISYFATMFIIISVLSIAQMFTF